jgi:hypothetical protein
MHAKLPVNLPEGVMVNMTALLRVNVSGLYTFTVTLPAASATCR